jgi:hypothetical protein
LKKFFFIFFLKKGYLFIFFIIHLFFLEKKKMNEEIELNINSSIKNLIPWDDLPVELTKDGEEEEDTVVVEEEEEDEEGLANSFIPLSSSEKLRKSGKYFEDFHVPQEFVDIVDHSEFPLLTNLEIIQSESLHKGTAKVDVMSDVATWAIITRQLTTFEEAKGGNPPSYSLTPEEKLTQEIGGKF